MFANFEQLRITTREVEINFRRGGEGPPVLLLHGYPQTHVMWRKVAPPLARRFTVLAPDLRGYGASSIPPSTADHRPYSKRVMGQDMLEAMHTLGFGRFAVVGHDRGGRVAYRMALDHPDAVEKLAVLDIVPTHTMWQTMDKDLAFTTYHWLFLAQPDGLPERMIEANASYYLRETLRRWARKRDAIEEAAIQAYLASLTQPVRIHAFCEDYRAGATVDLADDAADYGRRKIACPVLVLWGDDGIAAEVEGESPLETWRKWADDVRGRGLPCGHFLPEEAPDDTLAELLAFL
jgi:haloacetate dehalogenase